MPSPEHHYHRRAETPTTSPRMQAVVTDLAAYYEIDITQAGSHFTVDRPEQATRWVIANLDGERIDVARCPLAEEAFMVPDIDLLFAITPNGWQTQSVVHTEATWEGYVKAANDQGRPPTDLQGNFPFSAFAEYVAHLIEAEEQGERARDRDAVKDWFTPEENE
jgi:hypothetical protein